VTRLARHKKSPSNFQTVYAKLKVYLVGKKLHFSAKTTATSSCSVMRFFFHRERKEDVKVCQIQEKKNVKT
jgi:hypothetical protein